MHKCAVQLIDILALFIVTQDSSVIEAPLSMLRVTQLTEHYSDMHKQKVVVRLTRRVISRVSEHVMLPSTSKETTD